MSTSRTLTPVNNGSSEGVEKAGGKKDVHKKLAGGESTPTIDNSYNEGEEKVVGKKDKQATGVTTTIPANNEPNENRKLAGGDSTTPLPVNSGSNEGVDKSNGNMGNHKQLTHAVLQQTGQKKLAESLLLKRTGVQNDTHKDCVSKKEFNVLKEDFRSLKDDFRRLKRKIRSDQEQVDSDQPLEKKKELATSLKSETPTSPSEMLSSNDEVKYNNHTTFDLEDSISHVDNLYSAVKILILKLFPETYIISHSVTGKASNSKVDAKPQFDIRLYNILLSVIKNKFGSTKDVTAKVHFVQKFIQNIIQSKRYLFHSPVLDMIKEIILAKGNRFFALLLLT